MITQTRGRVGRHNRYTLNPDQHLPVRRLIDMFSERDLPSGPPPPYQP
ncbi:hypothetical protein ACIBHY_28855 [Nonomuraea sp. NPDC050547]